MSVVTRISAAILLSAAIAASGLEAARGQESPPPRACSFLDATLIPQMVMGVRRVDDEDVEVLELLESPAFDANVSGEAKLFRPYFVRERRDVAKGQTWFRIQADYASAEPLGWVRGADVESLRSRYAYSFAKDERQRMADLHDVSKESYDRLIGQLKGQADAAAETVVVRELEQGHTWTPVSIDDIVPFIELRVPEDAVDPKYPDTTPTFRFGISVENRLVHMGAICGGPIDVPRLKTLQERIKSEAGLEMLFVIDETESMRPFFDGVAKFIESAGTAAASRPDAEQIEVPVSIGVAYYTDGPEGKRVSVEKLRRIDDKAKATEIATTVKDHEDKLPEGRYANAPERMLEGLRNGVQQAGFSAGSNAFVAVIGDTGHEPDPPEDKEKLLDQVAGLIKEKNLHVFLAHVGNRNKQAEILFQKDADELRTRAVALGVPADRVVYQAAEKDDLAGALRKAQKAAEELRRRTQRQIERMEARTPFTEPGPKLLAKLEKKPLTRERFDDQHLQYYVPSRGWLFHPQQAGGSDGPRPQFRELFFVAAPERQALKALFSELRIRISEGRPIEADVVIEVFASALAKSAGCPELSGRVLERWNAIPAAQRSLGVFLEDAFGLRMKSALPYPVGGYEKALAADEIRSLQERIGRLLTAFGDSAGAEKPPFWFEASSLTP